MKRIAIVGKHDLLVTVPGLGIDPTTVDLVDCTSPFWHAQCLSAGLLNSARPSQGGSLDLSQKSSDRLGRPVPSMFLTLLIG